MQNAYARALSAGRAAVASFKPTRLDPPCKHAHDHVTDRYERALSWAAAASERGRMTASIAESRRHSSPGCGEQRPSKNVVRIISTLLWSFPNRPGAAGWLHLATYRHECARVMCILWAVHWVCVRGASRPPFRAVGYLSPPELVLFFYILVSFTTSKSTPSSPPSVFRRPPV